MSSFRAKIYLFFTAALVLLVFLLVPRGSTVLNTTISMAPDGKPVINSAIDKKSAFSENDSQLQKYIKTQGIYGQSVEKIDYGFVVYNRVFYRFDLTNVPSSVPAKLVFSADMPGEILEVKNGNIEGNKAYWLLESGKSGDFFAESKVVRWWLILLSAFLVLGLTYFVVARVKYGRNFN